MSMQSGAGAPTRMTVAARIAMTVGLFAAFWPSAAKAADAGSVPAGLYDQAKKEGQLVIYASISSDALTSGFSKAFNTDYPGITVKFVTGSASSVSARYQSEAQAGVTQGDVVLAGHSAFFTAGYQTKWFTPISSVVPNLTATYPSSAFLDNNNAAVVFRVVTGFAYNTDLVKGENIPQTFADFAKPYWKNRLAASDPNSSDTVFQVWYAIYKTYGATVVQQINANITASSKKQLSFVPGAAQVAAGEAYASLMQAQTTVAGLQANGAPIKWSRPAVTTSTTYILGVSAKAPHPAAAQLFSHWAYSAAGQKGLTAVNMSQSPLTDSNEGLLAPEENVPAAIKAQVMGLLTN